ncbi:NAD(P)/FAD-dependent oxidoreductase [Hydrogenophaga sp. RWCD_12]|uniref:NAD(P)/FAD-dependent oxidoreductase n=1 Tax=Hydrogenophaga sp. RWCD_12 TaxID=3391190 RepID=UPI003984FC00
MDPRQRAGEPASAPASEPVAVDAVVIGAGPVGLFQVFELGLLDIRAHVIDALPHIGGQPVELYPDKPIYDIPGVPVCTGQGLVDALRQQCAPFSPVFHLGQTVRELERQADGRFLVGTSKGIRLVAKTVFIAAGVGAFEPRRLGVDGLDVFEDSQLFFRASDAGALNGRHVLIVGDDEQAIECALGLSDGSDDRPASVTLVHRRDSFRADPQRVALMRERCAQGAMRFVAGQMTGFKTQEERLSSVDLAQPDGTNIELPLDRLLVLQGLSPRLGPIAAWGLAMERKQLVVDTATYSTSERDIFAVGDINTYAGKRKLLVCGFHECTLAAYAAAPIVHPNRPVLLQYTTTSTHLHQLLQVHNAHKE